MLQGVAKQGGIRFALAEVGQAQFGPALIDPLFQGRWAAEGLAPLMAFLRAHLGGGINGQAAAEAQALTGEIEGIEGGVFQHKQIPLGIHLGADGPDHLAGIADVDALVHHHHKLGVGELGQGTPKGHGSPLGLAGVGLVDGDHGQLVTQALHGQEKVDDFRDLLAQDRRVDPVQGDRQHRFLLGGPATEGGQEDRIAPLGHAVEAHQGRRLFSAVKAHVVAAGTIRQFLARGDRALKHHFAVGRHFQVHGFALGQPHPFAGIEPGKQPFAQLHRDGRGGGHHQQGVNADGHGHLQLFAHLGGLAQVPGPTPHTQPVHGHGVDRLPLQAVDPHIGHPGFRVFGDHQPQGDHPARIPWPGAQQR